MDKIKSSLAFFVRDNLGRLNSPGTGVTWGAKRNTITPGNLIEVTSITPLVTQVKIWTENGPRHFTVRISENL